MKEKVFILANSYNQAYSFILDNGLDTNKFVFLNDANKLRGF